MIGFVRIIQRSDDRDVFLAFEKLFVFFREEKKRRKSVPVVWNCSFKDSIGQDHRLEFLRHVYRYYTNIQLDCQDYG